MGNAGSQQETAERQERSAFTARSCACACTESAAQQSHLAEAKDSRGRARACTCTRAELASRRCTHRPGQGSSPDYSQAAIKAGGVGRSWDRFGTAQPDGRAISR